MAKKSFLITGLEELDYSMPRCSFFRISFTWDSLRSFPLGVLGFHQTGKNFGRYLRFFFFFGPSCLLQGLQWPAQQVVWNCAQLERVASFPGLRGSLPGHSCSSPSHVPVPPPWGPSRTRCLRPARCAFRSAAPPGSPACLPCLFNRLRPSFSPLNTWDRFSAPAC